MHSYNVPACAPTAAPTTVFDGMDTELHRVNQPFFGAHLRGRSSEPDLHGPARLEPGFHRLPTGRALHGLPRHQLPVTVDTREPAQRTGRSATRLRRLFASGQPADLPLPGSSAGHLRPADSTATRSRRRRRPTGPGQRTPGLLFEDFEDAGGLAGWTVTTGPGPAQLRRLGARPAPPPSGRRGRYRAASWSPTRNALRLAAADLDEPSIRRRWTSRRQHPDDHPGVRRPVRALQQRRRHRSRSGTARSGSCSGADTDADVNQQFSFDVTAYALGNPGFRVRFNYQNANYGPLLRGGQRGCDRRRLRPSERRRRHRPAGPAGRNGTTPLTGDRTSLPATRSTSVGRGELPRGGLQPALRRPARRRRTC